MINQGPVAFRNLSRLQAGTLAGPNGGGTMRFRTILLAMMAALVLFGSVGTSQAGLNAVDLGPYVADFGNYPVWYQDTNGRALQLCRNESLCLAPVLPNPDPAVPMSFPDNWPDELFWFTGETSIIGGGVDLRYVSAIEAAFSGGVVDGGQITFARIRFVADLATPGTYTITHPYGIHVFEVAAVDAGREIFFTEDIGIGAPGDFTGALKGSVGPYLVRVDALGNPSLITALDGIFIGDPGVTQRVTGSPFGTNCLRIQGPGVDITTDQFFVSGKLYEQTLPSPLVVDRTTYSRTALQTQVDVFATSAPTATLSFTPPATLMGGDVLGRFFGQALGDPFLSPVDISADNPLLNNTPVTKAGNVVTDLVSITSVTYTGGTLVIEASSSDEVSLPTLSFGSSTLTPTGVGATQSVTVSGLAIPPATVIVTSSAGGSDTEDVVVLP